MRTRMNTWAGALAGAGFALIGSVGMTQVPASPAFEVAAIRAANLPTPQSFQSGQFRIGSTINGTSLDFEFVSLADLLSYAYGVKSFQVAGPDWMSQTRWNIQARLPEGSSKDKAPEMMQALLADRFKLTIHREKRPQPVYELLVAKGGAKLEPAAASADATPEDSGAVAIGFGIPGLPPPGPGLGRGAAPPEAAARDGRGAVIASGGTRISPGNNCGIKIKFDKVTMQNLADTLTPFLNKPVVDATELKGTYKIAMGLPMEVMFSMM
jgi:uncharacterized protein (TIGR03435 family)